MAPFQSAFRPSFWHIVLLILVIAMITWYWFDQEIETIDTQIQNLHQ